MSTNLLENQYAKPNHLEIRMNFHRKYAGHGPEDVLDYICSIAVQTDRREIEEAFVPWRYRIDSEICSQGYFGVTRRSLLYVCSSE